MITAERLRWLNENKAHGEILKVVKQLNPKNTTKGISYTAAGSILSGDLWGRWGASFTDALEKTIRERQKREAREMAKYTTIKTTV